MKKISKEIRKYDEWIENTPKERTRTISCQLE